MMVPYSLRQRSDDSGYVRVTQTTYSSACGSATSTVGPETNYYHDGDNAWWQYTSLQSQEDSPLPLPKEKPKFERVMKMRNTDGRPIPYILWKPVQMYNGRDNIGVRNYKKRQP